MRRQTLTTKLGDLSPVLVSMATPVKTKHTPAPQLTKHRHFCHDGHYWTVFTTIPKCKFRGLDGSVCPVVVACPSHPIGGPQQNV